MWFIIISRQQNVTLLECLCCLQCISSLSLVDCHQCILLITAQPECSVSISIFVCTCKCACVFMFVYVPLCAFVCVCVKCSGWLPPPKPPLAKYWSLYVLVSLVFDYWSSWGGQVSLFVYNCLNSSGIEKSRASCTRLLIWSVGAVSEQWTVTSHY